MFRIVVCPRCGRAKGVEPKKETTSCPCGFEIQVAVSRTAFETSDARELAAAIGRLNAELRGGAEEVAAAGARPRRRSKDAYQRVIAVASRAGDRRQKVRTAAVELTREFVLFTADDWRRVAEPLGIGNPTAALEELVRGAVVYEPKPRYYRAV